MFSVKGIAGSQWLNVAAFSESAGVVNYAQKIGSDIAPSGGAFTLSINSGSLNAGANTIAIVAFSVAAGSSGGTSTVANLSINVASSTSTSTTTSTSTATLTNTTTATSTSVGSGTTYYVSPTGNDANNGTSASTPWQTINHVNAGASYAGGGLSPGQSVLFQGGQSFTGCLVFATGTNIKSSSASSPIIVGSYGSGVATINSSAACAGSNNGSSGPRMPLIKIDGASAALTGFTLQNLVISANGTATQYGILIQSSSGQTSSYITVQNVTVKGFNTTASGDTSAEIQVLGYPLSGAAIGPLDHIFVLNSILMGANGIGSPDDAGINGYGYGEDITNVNYSGNTVYNLGGRPGVADTGAGIMVGGVNGGIVSHNVIHDIGGNTNSCGGMSGIESYNVNGITVSWNEVYNVQPIAYTQGCDWDGIDLDGGTVNSIAEYNYTHHNFGAGFLGYVGAGNGSAWGPNTYRYNISEDDSYGPSSYFGSFCMAGPGVSGAVYNIYNNTIYQNSPVGSVNAPALTIDTPASSGVIANNIFASGASQYGQDIFVSFRTATAPGLTFSNNAYWSVNSGSFMVYQYGNSSPANLSAWQAIAPGGEKNATTASPMFSGSIPAGNCASTAATNAQACPAAYILGSASSYIGAGVNLAAAPYHLNVGSSDYFGNPIPNTVGSGYNIGAYGGVK